MTAVIDDEEGDEDDARDKLQSSSFDDDDVTTALSRSDDEQLQSLIGDMSAGHALPVVSNSKHPDLKTITPDTVGVILLHDDVI